MMSETSLPMPYDDDAERCTLGACLTSNAAVFEAGRIVGAQDYYIPIHRDVFAAVLSVAERGVNVDMQTVATALKKAGKLAACGGAVYLVQLLEGCPSAVNVSQYATRVRECAVLREIRAVSWELWQRANDRANAAELLNEMQAKIIRMSVIRTDSEPELISKTMHRIYGSLDDPESATCRIGFGIPEIDEMLMGLQPGNLIVVAARTTLGKSWLAIQSLLYNAGQGVPCALFSLEMTKEEVARRLLALYSGINAHRMRRGHISDDEVVVLADSAAKFQNIPIVIDAPSSLSVFDLHVRARQLKLQYGIGLLVVDHLGLMALPHHDNRAQAVGDVTRLVKALARELEMPIVLLHQLNREVRDGEPKLHHLRDSGNVEQDADTVLLLHRKGPNSVEATLTIAKQRNGPTGYAELLFDSEIGGFVYPGHPRWNAVDAAKPVEVKRNEIFSAHYHNPAGDD